MDEELLEELRKLIDCQFISDIRLSLTKEKLLYYIEYNRMQGYSLEEWSEACDYLFEDGMGLLQFHDFESLLDYLKK
ncbi:MAG: hypothetical protein Q4B70_05690 [Lachnospiraceae bacterium]|nr:hypothetical protein [Lachnospiraceae bacterium]